jgi:hypothetical protein
MVGHSAAFATELAGGTSTFDRPLTLFAAAVGTCFRAFSGTLCDAAFDKNTVFGLIGATVGAVFDEGPDPMRTERTTAPGAYSRV